MAREWRAFEISGLGLTGLRPQASGGGSRFEVVLPRQGPVAAA